MSTQRPEGPRRRRIAGERRPARTDGGAAESGRPVQPRESEAEAESRSGAGTPPPAPSGPAMAAPAASDTSEPQGDEPAPAAGQRGWWGSTSSVLTLVGLLVAVLTLGGVMAVLGVGTPSVGDKREAEAAERAATTAPAAAERAAEAILAYDHQTLDANRDAATRFMTDDFAAQYSETFEKVVKPTATESRATVAATVKGSATVRATADRVRVLLFVDQTTVSRANENPQAALNRVEMIMVRAGDSWLVDDISSY